MPRAFEHLVIGKGMMGAAALRHLSAVSSRVAIVGPDEPTSDQAADALFSSNADQGRITTQVSKDATWGALTRRSVQGYAQLEHVSRIRFHQPLGVLHIAPARTTDRIEATAGTLAVPHRRVATPGAAAPEPLRWPSDHEALLELSPAGIIDPRALIRAQLSAAAERGAAVVSEVVVALQRVAGQWEATTSRGRRIAAERILLSMGAYTNCFGLLRRKLALRIKSETTILVEVSASESRRLEGMPAVIYDTRSPTISGAYLTPPLPYPDGTTCLKLGADTDQDRTLGSFEQIQDWMKAGCADVRSDMLEALSDLLPHLRPRSVRVKRCLVTYSEHGKPYIDDLGDGLFIATAGNGAAAACSDTLGSLAADLMTGREWPDGFLRAEFEHRLLAEAGSAPHASEIE